MRTAFWCETFNCRNKKENTFFSLSQGLEYNRHRWLMTHFHHTDALSSTWCAFASTEGLMRAKKLDVCLILQDRACAKTSPQNFPEKRLICSWDDEVDRIACVIQLLPDTPLWACIDIYTTIQCRFSQCAHSKMSCEEVQYIRTAKACRYPNTPLISQIIRLHTGSSVVVINMCNGGLLLVRKGATTKWVQLRWFFFFFAVWILGCYL